MRLSKYVCSVVAVLSPGANAFYPYVKTSIKIPSNGRLESRFFPYHIDSETVNGDGDVLSVPLKKISKLTTRENQYHITESNAPTFPDSAAIGIGGDDLSYVISVGVGSQNQTLWMLLDTGGLSTWVFSSDCTAEPCTVHSTFDADKSTSLKENGLDFTIHYGTGTVSGVTVTDDISFAGLKLRIPIGLAAEASADFMNYPMDGIFGLGRSNSSGEKEGTTFMDAAAKEGLFKRNIVGINLHRLSDDSKDGEVTFGDIDKSKFTGDISYTKVTSDVDKWEIPVGGVSVDGEKIDLPNKLALIDTGTSFIFLPPDDATALHALIKGSEKAGDTFLIPCDCKQDVAFEFSGISYSVSPKDYVGEQVGDNKCRSNIIGVQTDGPDDWLLGATFLKNVYAVFDYDEDQIGFARQTDAPEPKPATTTVAASASLPTAAAAKGSDTDSDSSSSGEKDTSSNSPHSDGAFTLPIPWTVLASLGSLCLSLVL